jgi:hypothetical protein
MATYLLTPWSRVLLEKLTGFAASQEIPHIYGTRKFMATAASIYTAGSEVTLGRSRTLDRKVEDGYVFIVGRQFGLCREVSGMTILKWALETWTVLAQKRIE